MSPFAGLCPLSKANYIQLQGDKAVSVVSIGQQLLVLGHFEAVVDNSEWHWVTTGLFLCYYIILQKSRDLIKKLTSACMLQSSQVTRVPEVLWSQIPISACLFQSSKLPEFQKFYGRRHLTLPVLCKVTNYQSSRSFMASNCDLYVSNSKFPSFESFKFPKLQIHPRILPLL